MSHFAVYVLAKPDQLGLENPEALAEYATGVAQVGKSLPGSATSVLVKPHPNLEEAVGQLLKPYDENDHVPAYNERCWCVGRAAEKEVRERINAEHPELDIAKARERGGAIRNITYLLTSPRATEGTREALLGERADLLEGVGLGDILERLRADDWRTVLEDEEARERVLQVKREDHRAWGEMIDKRRALEAEMLAAHPFSDVPDATCGFSHYGAFDLAKNAPAEEVEPAYRRALAESEERYRQELDDAYATLSDPEKRAKYDIEGDPPEEGGCHGTGLSESTYNPLSKWDWWQIGGRWTGALGDYDPVADPANKEVCWVCRGTGKRDDAHGQSERAEDPSYTCNGCQGTGMDTKFPTEWLQRDNVRPVAGWPGWKWSVENPDATDSWDGDAYITKGDPNGIHYPFAVVTPDGAWHEKGRMLFFAVVADAKDPDDWHATVDGLWADNPDAICVVVDCHI